MSAVLSLAIETVCYLYIFYQTQIYFRDKYPKIMLVTIKA